MLPFVFGTGKSNYAVRCAAMFLACAGLLISLGCATVKDSVVLVKDADGKVGQLTVTTKGGTRTLTLPNTMVEVTGAAKSPSDPVEIDQSRIDSLFGAPIKATTTAPVRIFLYFLHDSTELTAD